MQLLWRCLHNKAETAQVYTEAYIMAKPDIDVHVLLNILGYKEDGDWVALALEFDLRGYGQTFEDAMEELTEMIQMQVSFAMQTDKPEMMFKDAEPQYFKIYDQARREHLRNFYISGMSPQDEFRIDGVPIPPAHMVEQFIAADA
jgi:predicted RNase H-like HicB family nuclease